MPDQLTRGAGQLDRALREQALLTLAGAPPCGYTRFVGGWFCDPIQAGSTPRMLCKAEVWS